MSSDGVPGRPGVLSWSACRLADPRRNQNESNYKSPLKREDRDSDEDYVFPTEDKPREQEDDENTYEAPPPEASNPPRWCFPAKPLDDGDYIDAILSHGDSSVGSEGFTLPQGRRPRDGPKHLRPCSSHSVQPSSCGDEQLQQRSLSTSAKHPHSLTPPRVDRSTKPSCLKISSPGGGVLLNSRNPPCRPKHAGLGGPHSSLPPGVAKGKQQRDVPAQFSSSSRSDRCSTAAPQPPAPPTIQQFESEQDPDPRWYMGQVTREQAEHYLRQVGQDGTFLIRDSSQCSSSQPYTLMVLYQGKVYNIQIRYHSHQRTYALGTRGNKSYLGLSDLIQHHRRAPLMLIDGKEQGSAPQKECLLTHPANA
ncbi:lymphocyte cytosolic protein 2 [Anguilla rostrata]|uniref:lymphocyte cytosolic protein 2 n=1 Tax=Anguilla rostrata TaxID=7938 RepID=UPI0030CBEE8B